MRKQLDIRNERSEVTRRFRFPFGSFPKGKPSVARQTIHNIIIIVGKG